MSRPEFGEVRVRERFVVIVAGGPSLRRFDFSVLAGLPVIAVNAAVLHSPARYWLTVDPGARNYGLMADPIKGVRYYAAVPRMYGMRQRGTHPDHRVEPLPHVTYLRRVESPVAADRPTRMKRGLAKSPGEIHTGNSAYGALGLAFHMWPRRIALLGVDGTDKAYFFGDCRPVGNLAHLAQLFRSALPDLDSRKIEVVNGSPASAVTCFRCSSPMEAVEWAAEA